MKPTHTFNINIEDAQNALTETEFGILTALFNKVENYRIEQEDPIRDILELLTLKGKSINNIYGQPGVGKTKNIEKLSGDFKYGIEDHLFGDPIPLIDLLMFEIFINHEAALFKDLDFSIIEDEFRGMPNKVRSNRDNDDKLKDKLEELMIKKVPVDLILELQCEAIKNNSDTYEFIIEQERKAREMGVSLSMYVKQQMSN